MEKGWVKIFSSSRIHKAELLKSILMQSGIHSVVLNNNDSLAITSGEAELYVNQDDVLRAKLIITKTSLEDE